MGNPTNENELNRKSVRFEHRENYESHQTNPLIFFDVIITTVT